MKKIIWLIIAISLIIVGIYLVEKRKNELNALPKTFVPLQAIEVTKAWPIKEKAERTFVGTLNADKRTILSTRVSERIIFIAPEALAVKQGDVLVRLDSSEMSEIIAQSKHQLKALEHTLKGLLQTSERMKAELAHEQTIYARNKSLFAIGGVAKEVFDASALSVKQKETSLQSHLETYQATLSEYASTEAILASKLAQSEYYTLYAPYDGIIINQMEEVGSVSKPGSALLEMANTKEVVRFSYVGNLTLNQQVEVEGVVGHISKLLPQTSQLLMEAEAILGETLEKPLGALVHINVFEGFKNGYALPLRALLQEDNKTYILVYTGKYFEKTEVSVLLQTSKIFIIEEELKMPIALGSPSKLAALHLHPHVRLVGNE